MDGAKAVCQPEQGQVLQGCSSQSRELAQLSSYHCKPSIIAPFCTLATRNRQGLQS